MRERTVERTGEPAPPRNLMLAHSILYWCAATACRVLDLLHALDGIRCGRREPPGELRREGHVCGCETTS
jgi:hypothetical protein